MAGKPISKGVLRRTDRARSKDLSGARVKQRSPYAGNICIREWDGSVEIIPIRSIVEAQCHPKTIHAGFIGLRESLKVYRFGITTKDNGIWLCDILPSDKEMVIDQLRRVIR